MPRTNLDPSDYLKIKQATPERRQSVTIEALTPEAIARDAFYSALVSFLYLHWLETGMSPTLSLIAFRNAVLNGEILSGNPIATKYVEETLLLPSPPEPQF
jgi:hypothetical protein